MIAFPNMKNKDLLSIECGKKFSTIMFRRKDWSYLIFN